MYDLILFAAINRMWYTLPLVVSVSLVYSATRHEQLVPILQHAFRTAVWILGFMLVAFVVLYLIQSWL
jgi:hypothetical protein